ncbi:hypothetical protein KR018_010562 [Drosophila ironensis]|nr:hypothetical protein KR018_010562 [Drosophila ironensis]
MPGRVFRRHIWHLLRHEAPQECQSFKNPVVLAAAVRTPSAPLRMDEQRLGALVVDELIKRSTVPRTEFTRLILCYPFKGAGSGGLAADLALKCEVDSSQAVVCSISDLQMALEGLQNGGEQCIITGDIRRQVVQPEQGLQANELMAVQEPRVPKRLSSQQAPASILGAAALAWTTQQAAQRLQLQPLAILRELAVDRKLYRLDGSPEVTPSDIHTWHLMPGVNNSTPQILPAQRVITQDFKQATVSHILTHLVHSLPAGALGCASLDTPDGRSLLVVLERLAPVAKGLPVLTLYTRDPCPLCDELVQQLEEQFPGQYRLDKVYIDRKENVRFLRLFRHDIPVLFLNGQFLCMHRLNEEALRERLTR